MWELFGYFSRFWRRLRPGGNPLARTSDRIEAGLLLFAIIGTLLALPFAAALGSANYADQRDAAQSQSTSYHQATATLLEDASPPMLTADGGSVGSVTSDVPATWKSRTGVAHTGNVTVQTGAAAGATVPVWLDGKGNIAPAPMAPADAAIGGVLVAVFGWLAAILGLVGVYWVGRWVLDRHRAAQWDREWAGAGGDWTRF